MRNTFIVIALLVATATPSWAAVVRLLDEGSGQYRIEGEGLDGVAALDMSVNYDSSTLQITKVSQGTLLQGMMFVANPNQLGRVRIGAVSTQSISGSGILASLSGSVKSSSAVVLSFTVKLSDSSGESLPVRTEFPSPSQIGSLPDPATLPTETLPESAGAPEEGQVGSNSSTALRQGTSSLVAAELVNLPAPWEARESESPQPAEPSIPYVDPPSGYDPRAQNDSKSSEQPSVPYVEKQQFEFSSILETFEKYEGPRTLAALALLFERETSTIQQRPAILLADGDGSIEIDLLMMSATEPSIALKNARLIRTGFVDENRFVVRCIPEKGAMSAKLLFLGTEEIVAIPLTVAPLISLAGFDVNLDEPLPKLDLDGDGGSNWRDDYILVANLLVQERVAKKSEERK